MRAVPLSELVHFVSGGTPRRSEKAFYEGETPWVTGADLAESGTIVHRHLISKDAIDGSSANVVPKGTVLLVTRTSVGKVAMADRNLAFSQDITALMPSDALDARYLAHFLRARAHHLRRHARGATIKGVDRATVAALLVPLPTHVEGQRRIAAILDHAEALRVKRHKVLAHLERLTASIFRQMFGDTSRPRIRLESIAEWRSGGTPSRTQPELFGGPLPWFTSGELGRTYVSETRETLTELGLKTSSAKRIEAQNVLVGMYDTAALKTGITLVEASCNQAVAFSHRIQYPYSAEYVQVAIENERERILALRRGVRQKNLNLSMIRAIDIPTADEAEVAAFGRQVRSIHRSMERLVEEQRLEDELFAALQSRAFHAEL